MTSTPPSDEFDAVVLQHDGRRGAHRARPNRVSTVLSAGLVAVATLAVAGGAYVLLGPGARSSTPAGASTVAAGAAGAVVDAPAAEATPTTDAPLGADAATATSTATSGTVPGTVSGTVPGTTSGTVSGVAPRTTAASSRSASTTASTTTAPRAAASASAAGATATTRSAATARTTGSPDTAVPLVVLNGTRTRGLAATASTRLHSSGWKVQSTGNDRSGTAATTVTYADPALATTAAAVAADVGGSAVRDASATEGVLTVVLGPDYSG